MCSIYNVYPPYHAFYVALGRYTAILIIIIVLVMPYWNFLIPGISYSMVMSEPESRSFHMLYRIVSYLLHTPVFIFCIIFAYRIGQDDPKLTSIYISILLSLALSAIYFGLLPVPREFWWSRLIPTIAYYVFLVPPLTLGFYYSGKTNVQIKRR